MTELTIRDDIDMDEQTREILTSLRETISSLSKDISYLKDGFAEIKECYITKAEFSPVRTVVYGAVGLICIAVLGAILALVIIKQGG